MTDDRQTDHARRNVAIGGIALGCAIPAKMRGEVDGKLSPVDQGEMGTDAPAFIYIQGRTVCSKCVSTVSCV